MHSLEWPLKEEQTVQASNEWTAAPGSGVVRREPLARD